MQFHRQNQQENKHIFKSTEDNIKMTILLFIIRI